AGFPVPLAGGSGKDDNRTPLGSPRTYARIPPGEPFGYKAWVEAVRAGRTFVTTGPLVSLEVEGRGPGEAVEAAGPLVVRATAESLSPFEKLELVANGAVIGSAAGESRPDRGDWSARLEVP